ncbi:L-threonylcarbamoyladenylate synthase [Desulfatiferula olefinivorans]
MLIPINPDNPQARLIDKVVACLKDGGIIAYPTDTYYGIGCDIMNKKAIEKVYQIKRRDPSKPFSFICSDLKHISDYAKVSNYAYRTLKRCLPGPYTFILEGSKLVPKIMLTKRKNAGIRVPDNAICMAIIQGLGNPVISTTATFDDDEPILDAWMISDTYPHQIDIVIDGGPVPNRPSSVISLVDDEPEILREGAGDISFFE